MRFSFIFTLLLFSIKSYSSEKETFIVSTRYIVLLDNGKKTADKVAENQKTYNTKGQLFREVHYDTATKQIQSFDYFFYNDNNHLLSKESYNIKNELISMVHYKYTKDNTTLVNFYHINAQSPQLDSSYTVTYPNAQTEQKTYLNAKNKWYRKEETIYTTSAKKKKQQTTITFHKKRGESDFTRIQTKFNYNKDSLLSLETTRYYINDEEVKHNSATYTYIRNSAFLESKTIKNTNNEVSTMVRYMWRDLRPYSQDFLNNDNTVQRAYRFEVYNKDFIDIGGFPSKIEILTKD